jgi:hypothetical protein
MSTLEILITQVVISLLVVTLYHLWASRNKQAAPLNPAPNLNPNLNPNPNLQSVSRAIQPAPPASVPLAPPVPALAVPIPTPPKPLPAPQPMPPEILAVIAAAITVVLGRPHRVVSVHQAAVPAPDINVWALEGRMKHFMSHKVR